MACVRLRRTCQMRFLVVRLLLMDLYFALEAFRYSCAVLGNHVMISESCLETMSIPLFNLLLRV